MEHDRAEGRVPQYDSNNTTAGSESRRNSILDKMPRFGITYNSEDKEDPFTRRLSAS